MRLQNIKISTLLLVGCAALIAVVSAIALLATYISRDSNQALETLYQQRLVPLEHLKKLADLYADIAFKANQISLGRGAPEQAHQEVIKASDEINEHWKELSVAATGEKDIQALHAATAVAQKMAPAITELLDALSKKDRMRTSLVALDLNDFVNLMGKQVNNLEQIQLDHSGEEFQQANSRYQWSIRSFGMAVTMAIAATLAAAWLLIGAITGPIRQAVAIAKRVATGNMSEAIDYSGQSEMAEMLRALHEMQKSLGHVVSEVRNSADRLANASGEIAQGNMELSDRTEQQASLLEQTHQATHSLGSTVRENTDNAQRANSMAQQASTVAAMGGQVVAEVVETMKDINTSSQKIGDIIGVIDGIAFQTNILALNAAVEAARAGEQGRGFAVVATEVRALASRSASAAKEIKALINTSVGRVQTGTVLVARAGKTMEELVSSIARVTEIVAHISESGHSQNAAVDQVSDSLDKMAKVTQRNTSMVEEIASSANDLSAQAHTLVSAVAVFKLQPESEALQLR